MSVPEFIQTWLNYYECPTCDYHFYDVYDCTVNEQCDSCGQKHIGPANSWELPDGGIDDMAVYDGDFVPLV